MVYMVAVVVCVQYTLNILSVLRCVPLCIRHIVTWAIEFLVSHYNQLFSVNNRSCGSDRNVPYMCGNIWHMHANMCDWGQLHLLTHNVSVCMCMYCALCNLCMCLNLYFYACLCMCVCLDGIFSSLIDSKIKCCYYSCWLVFAKFESIELLNMCFVWAWKHCCEWKMKWKINQIYNIHYISNHRLTIATELSTRKCECTLRKSKRLK